MKKQMNTGAIVSALAMLTMILDTKTALNGAKDGLNMCLQAVIPSLFPFFVVSGIINSSILGLNLPLIEPLRKVCKLPKGTGSIMLLGFIAGYPVGAQLIGQAHMDKKLSTTAASRMLGFCSNAGISFLFGMIAPMFQSVFIPWILWGIHICSALFVGIVLPKAEEIPFENKHTKPISFSEAIKKAFGNISLICGWIIIFRIVIAFAQKWFLWRFPTEMQVLFSGFLELSNGCVLLKYVSLEGLRFVLASCMLAAGGACVAIQTLSVTGSLGFGLYFPGKLLQTAVSCLLSILLQPVIFQQSEQFKFPHFVLIIGIGFVALFIIQFNRKILVAFTEKVLYNKEKHCRKGATVCCSARE